MHSLTRLFTSSTTTYLSIKNTLDDDTSITIVTSAMLSFVVSTVSLFCFALTACSLPTFSAPSLQFAPNLQKQLSRVNEVKTIPENIFFAKAGGAQKPLGTMATRNTPSAQVSPPTKSGKAAMNVGLKFESGQQDGSVHYVELPLRRKVFIRKRCPFTSRTCTTSCD